MEAGYITELHSLTLIIKINYFQVYIHRPLLFSTRLKVNEYGSLSTSRMFVSKTSNGSTLQMLLVVDSLF